MNRLLEAILRTDLRFFIRKVDFGLGCRAIRADGKRACVISPPTLFRPVERTHASVGLVPNAEIDQLVTS